MARQMGLLAHAAGSVVFSQSLRLCVESHAREHHSLGRGLNTMLNSLSYTSNSLTTRAAGFSIST
jgi:hypothetical protein